MGSTSFKSADLVVEDKNLKQNLEAFKGWFSNFPIVSGPVGFTFFPNVGGRAFFIFGDVHDKGFECGEGQGGTPIENVLGTIWASESSTSQKIHDFFFEHTFICNDESNDEDKTCIRIHWADEKYIGTSIGNINVKFSECFSAKDKNVCIERYPLTRFHYIDYRFSYLPSGGITISTKTKIFKSLLNSFSGAYMERVPPSSDEDKTTLDFGDVLTLFSPLLLGGGFLRAYVENFFNNDFSNDEVLKSFIKREIKNKFPYTTGIFFLLKYTAEYNVPGFRRRILRNVKQSTHGSQIEAWILSIVEDYVLEYEEIMKSPFDSSPGDINETVEEKITSLVSEGMKMKFVKIPLKTFERLSMFSLKAEKLLIPIAGRLELDAPTIGRMFKPSIVEKGSRYVWFYGGQNHSDTIEGFLEYITLGKDEEGIKYKSSSISKRCIRVPKV